MAKSSIKHLKWGLKFQSSLFTIANNSSENGGVHRFSVHPNNYNLLVKKSSSTCIYPYFTLIPPLSTNRISKNTSSSEIYIRRNHWLPSPIANFDSTVFYFRNRSTVARFCSGKSDAGKLGLAVSNSSVVRPLKVGWRRYREVIGLQLDAFWKRNYVVVVAASGLVLCFFLWRLMFTIANTFIGLSEGVSKYGFLALSASIVAFSGAYARSRYTINPERVYRMAMRRLNASASILEVMGAPLSGTEIRAYVMSGGGLTLKTFKPYLRSKRCFLIFPIHGSDKKGLVSVEVKKKKGQHNMKLLAVDVAMGAGNEQRLFVEGDEKEYRVGGGIISELRDPVVKAMEAAAEFEDIDTIEEENDSLKEIEASHRKQRPAESDDKL